MKYCVVPVTVLNQNCSLVWCKETNAAVVIDPGGSVDLLCRKIDLLKIDVKKILLTHGHIDHVGGAYELAQRYSIPILGPDYSDKMLLDNISMQCHMFGFDIVPVIIPDIWLLDNDKIWVGNIVFTVVHCPGHSPGHIAFWNKKSQFIITGDVLFRGSIGRTDLPGGDLNILKKSIKKLFILCGNISFLPGHGIQSTFEYEIRTNPYLKGLLC